MIVSFAKEAGMTPKDVIWNVSYQNLILYAASIPHYDDVKDDWDESLDMCDPEVVKRMMMTEGDVY